MPKTRNGRGHSKTMTRGSDAEAISVHKLNLTRTRSLRGIKRRRVGRTVFIVTKRFPSPNVPDQRPGATDLRLSTRAISPGSLHLVCWAVWSWSPPFKVTNANPACLTGKGNCDSLTKTIARKCDIHIADITLLLTWPILKIALADQIHIGDRSIADGYHVLNRLLHAFWRMRRPCAFGEEGVRSFKVAFGDCASELLCDSRVNCHTRTWPNEKGERRG